MDSTTKNMKGECSIAEETADNKANHLSVSINLSDIDCNEPLPDRIVPLSYPYFSIAVGRGSLSDESIEPAPDNAWFSSRVMSRQHAIIRADPHNQMLTVQDDGSMHGTFLNGDRVGKEPVELLASDILTFGTEVVRGDETYQPLKISVNYDWEEQEENEEAASKTTSKETSFRNKFTVDFSEEDFDSDLDDEDDIQIVSEAVREPSVEILYPAFAPKPQLPQRPVAACQSPTAITSTTATIAPKELATNQSQPISDPLKASANQGGDEDHKSEASKALEDYHEDHYTDEEDDDEDESEINSEVFDGDDSVASVVGEDEDFVANMTKAYSVPQPAKGPASQSVPRNGTSAALTDTVGREPSPSDAALARPRVAAPAAPAAVKGVPIPVPPPRSAQTLNPTSYNGFFPHNNFDSDRIYIQDASRPSHSFVDSYPYNTFSTPMYSMGSMSTYPSATPTYPWDLWKSTSPAYSNPQPPPPPPRPITRFGPPFRNLASSLLSNPLSANADKQPPQNPFSTSTDSSRGKKRKADAVSEYSDVSASSVPVSVSVEVESFEGSSPAPNSSSPPTDLSRPSVRADKAFTSGSMEDDNISSCVHTSSSAEFKKMLEKVHEQHEGSLAGLESTTEAANHVELVSDEHEIELVVQEPPRKKAKADDGTSIARGSRTSTALKYTVTAIAGATIGALGTVVGLASLPVDYFV